jgi:hypothetical protein
MMIETSQNSTWQKNTDGPLIIIVKFLLGWQQISSFMLEFPIFKFKCQTKSQTKQMKLWFIFTPKMVFIKHRSCCFGIMGGKPRVIF